MNPVPIPRLRICIAQGAFLPVPPRLGGAVEKAWYALGREFARQGHDVTHIGRSYPGLPGREVDAGVRYRRVRGHDAPASLLKLKLLDLAYSLRVRSVLPRADILVTNTFWLPVVERRRSRGRVYVHVARFPKGQLRLYPRSAVLQTVSGAVREAILAETRGPESRVRLVPYPLSPGYLVDRAARPTRTILYAGRIHPEKGVHLLIDAFGRLAPRASRGWSLRIVGPWESRHGGGGEGYRAELQRQAQVLSGRVEFTGPIFDEQRLVEQYRDAAIFAYPSLAVRGETFGLAVLEAMAAGCAPVVSSLPCFRDFVVDGTSGLAFAHDAGDPAAGLAQMLARLTEDPELLESVRTGAWRAARAYALPAVAERYVRDFCQVMLPDEREGPASETPAILTSP